MKKFYNTRLCGALAGPGSQSSEGEVALQTSFPFQKWMVTLRAGKFKPSTESEVFSDIEEKGKELVSD